MGISTTFARPMSASRTKAIAKRIALPFRPHLRPSFLVIGAQKAGTSALFKMLDQHPMVLAPDIKELHFFDQDARYARGSRTYWDRFPLRPFRGPAPLTFEATPEYLFLEQVPARIAAVLPDVRMVVLLRDPVRRAYSAWNMRRSFKDSALYAHRYEPRSFEEAVEDELRHGALSGPLNDYLARGDYAVQLARYFALFPRERFLVLNYRDLQTDPVGVANRVCAFVGASAFTGGEPAFQQRFNERPYAEPLSSAMKERLYAHFAPLLRDLDRLLGAPVDLIEERAYAF